MMDWLLAVFLSVVILGSLGTAILVAMLLASRPTNEDVEQELRRVRREALVERTEKETRD